MASAHMVVNGDMEDVRLVAFSNGDPERAANWSTVRGKVVFVISIIFSFSLSTEQEDSRPDDWTCTRI
jgi:hypothetical protein